MNPIELFLAKNNLETEYALDDERAEEKMKVCFPLYKAKSKMHPDKYNSYIKSNFGSVSGWYKVKEWEKLLPNIPERQKKLYDMFFDLVVFVPSIDLNKQKRWFELDIMDLRLHKEELSSKEAIDCFSEEAQLKIVFSTEEEKENLLKKEIIGIVEKAVLVMEIELEFLVGLVGAIEEYLEEKLKIE